MELAVEASQLETQKAAGMILAMAGGCAERMSQAEQLVNQAHSGERRDARSLPARSQEQHLGGIESACAVVHREAMG